MMLRDLLNEKAYAEERIKEWQDTLAGVVERINELVAKELADVRKLQGKEFGAVNVLCEGFKITETIPKKVTWNQDKMNEIFFSIIQNGDNPSNYMKAKLEVSEKTYDGFTPEIKAVFDEALTVDKGKPTIKIDEVKL